MVTFQSFATTVTGRPRDLRRAARRSASERSGTGPTRTRCNALLPCRVGATYAAKPAPSSSFSSFCAAVDDPKAPTCTDQVRPLPAADFCALDPAGFAGAVSSGVLTAGGTATLPAAGLTVARCAAAFADESPATPTLVPAVGDPAPGCCDSSGRAGFTGAGAGVCVVASSEEFACWPPSCAPSSIVIVRDAGEACGVTGPSVVTADGDG